MKTGKVLRATVIAVLVVLIGTSVVVAQGGGSGDVVSMSVSGLSITWTPLVGGVKGMTLTVTGPGDFYMRQDFGGRATLSSRGLADGAYQYEIVLTPASGGDASSNELERGMRFFQSGSMTQSGGFMISGGAFVNPNVAEGGEADQVVPDDMIVQGSICAGFDCVNNENFGFDTIRLKENNTRLQFDDTSVGTFPSNNWQLRANSSSSGGSNFFGIVDQGATGNSETGTIVFQVEAGAAANSIFVDSTSRVGFRTSTPVLDLHVAQGNTPGLRLEQNGSGGFTPQTWDIAGNEANFFIRDVTGGSRLPFRIRPGAPTSSIDIAANGNVGIGTASPVADLHVQNTAANGILLVENTTGAKIKFAAAATRGNIGTENDFPVHFLVNNVSQMNIANNGNLTVTGSVTATAFNPSSDRYAKENFVAVDRASVLERLVNIPISVWNFKEGDSKATHMGPMAQDFYAAFGLGIDDKHISTVDADGVAFAAIQELHARNESLKSENAALQSQVDKLSDRVSALEGNGPLPANQSGLLIVLLVCLNLGALAWLVYTRRSLVKETSREK